METIFRRLSPPSAGRLLAPLVAAALAALLGTGGATAQGFADIERSKDFVIEGLVAGNRDKAVAAFDESVRWARSAVAASPECADAFYALAVALGYRLEHHGIRSKLRMAAEVRAAAERALALDPYHAGAHHVLGRLTAAAMRLNFFTRVVAREILGASVLEGASWEAAERHFLEARALEPWNPRHAMELGALYLDTDRPDRAREVLAEAVARVPRNAPDSLAVERARTLLARYSPR